MSRTIRSLIKDYTLHDNGRISLPNVQPSGSWVVVGAVVLSRFGRITKHYSLEEILKAPEAIPWRYKNGKQHVHLVDLDHGTRRIWMSPQHWVV